MQPRWYQVQAEQAVYDYFSHSSGNPLVLMPTGTGKSIVIGSLASNIIKRWPSQRLLMMTHNKYLINQNADKLRQMFPGVPLGIYSAGLKKRQAIAPIVYGGIQTIANNVAAMGHRDLVFVDEAHMVDDDEKSRYGQTFKALRDINPLIKIIGFTATGWRTRQGLLTNANETGYRVFTDVAYDLTTTEMFNRLVSEGYLAPLVAKPTDTTIDASKVPIIAGDYKLSALSKAVDQQEITLRALRELVAHSYDRVCGMVFAIDISHAEHINDMLKQAFGQSSVVIHSEREDYENDEDYKAWHSGRVKWAVTVGKLTTGVDNPRIDIMGMLRPTQSSQLWVQMLGRGTRPCPETGKLYCLVLDFARNTEQLGPINAPYIPKGRGEKREGEAPVKICEACNAYNHASARFCMCCGMEFEFKIKIAQEAGTAEVMTGGLPVIEYYDVDYVIHNSHAKRSDPNAIRLRTTYFCHGGKRFDEWNDFSDDAHQYTRKRAIDWLRQRINLTHDMEQTISLDNVLSIRNNLRNPKRIRVWVNREYPEVVGHEY